MSRPKTQLVINVEYFAFRVLYAIAGIMPRKILYPFMRFLFRIFYYLDAKHRNRAIRHILHSGIVPDRKAAVALAKRNFAHFGNVVGDILVADRYMTEANVDEHAKIVSDDPDLLADVTRRDADGKFSQCIVATAHFGNWEVAGNLYVWMGKRPVISVMRPLDNPKIGHFLYSVRESDKHQMCPKDGALKRLLKAVKEGRSLCLVVDQHAHEHEAIQVTCFGKPVWIHASLAKLHLRTRLPVFIGACRRMDDKNHYVFEPIAKIDYTPTDNPKKDAYIVTQLYMDAIEKMVRSAPEQWLWPHRFFMDLRREDWLKEQERAHEKS